MIERRRRPRTRSRSRDRTRRRANSGTAPRSRARARRARGRSERSCPASAALPSGSRLTRRRHVGEPLGVAREHRVVREQVMAERDRLRDLQMREAGHDRVGVLLREIDERAAQRDAAARSARRSRRAATGGRRSRPGRCASAPVCRRLPASPTSSVSRCSMLRWTSSRSSDHAKRPASISARDRRRGRARWRRGRLRR